MKEYLGHKFIEDAQYYGPSDQYIDLVCETCGIYACYEFIDGKESYFNELIYGLNAAGECLLTISCNETLIKKLLE